MAEPRTVPLYPLYFEHLKPMLVDGAAALIALPVLELGFGLTYGPVVVPVVLGIYALTHFVQMRWFVKVRFDDNGIVIIRPWRRQRIEWYQIAGLIYRWSKEGALHTRPNQRSRHGCGCELRLVLVGNLPSPHPTTLRQLEAEAHGPVVMIVGDLRIEDTITHPRPGRRCEEAVFEQLAEHGFPRPERKALCFQPRDDVNPNAGPDR